MLMLSRLQQSSRVSFSFSVTRNLMMWVRLFGLPLWVIGIVFTVFLVSISLQSFGRLHRMSRAEHRSNECKRFKTKAGFGEGTPQQVRPVSETRFQILKLWPQVDTCLSLFPSKMKIQISNWISVSKAGSACANRSVFYLRGSPLAPNLRSCPCVAAALSGSPAFCAGSWRGIQIQTAHLIFKVRSMKNCRPVVRLQILSGNKESRPARDQRILSGTSGGKMVRCGCGAAIY